MKKGKPAGKRGVHTAVVLPPDVLEQLRKSERGVSEEIRERINRTFSDDAIDPVTRELRDGLVNIAARLRGDFGEEWHASPRVFREFAAAVAQRLSAYEPPATAPTDIPDSVAGVVPPDEWAGWLGKVRERDDQAAHDYPQLKKAQDRRFASIGLPLIRRAKKEDEHE